MRRSPILDGKLQQRDRTSEIFAYLSSLVAWLSRSLTDSLSRPLPPCRSRLSTTALSGRCPRRCPNNRHFQTRATLLSGPS